MRWLVMLAAVGMLSGCVYYGPGSSVIGPYQLAVAEPSPVLGYVPAYPYYGYRRYGYPYPYYGPGYGGARFSFFFGGRGGYHRHGYGRFR